MKIWEISASERSGGLSISSYLYSGTEGVSAPKVSQNHEPDANPKATTHNLLLVPKMGLVDRHAVPRCFGFNLCLDRVFP